jgi:hypothetical protein
MLLNKNIVEINSILQLTWEFVEQTGSHIFLTGKAGTSKHLQKMNGIALAAAKVVM